MIQRSINDLETEKAALRRAALARRAAQSPALGSQLAGHILAELALPDASIIAGFWPLPGEIDLRTLWHSLHARGHAVVLPQTPPRGQQLIFRRWHPGCTMVPERFGTWHPDGDIATPTLILVPLLAFDAHGNRLGYGGGYYDRTLAALHGVPAIGVAYAAQRVNLVPIGAHDQPLHAVFSENGIEVDRRTAEP